MKQARVKDLKVGDIVFNQILNSIQTVDSIHHYTSKNNNSRIALDLGFIDDKTGQKRFYTKSFNKEDLILIYEKE